MRILEKCRQRCEELGYRLINIDATIVAEVQKVLPHRDAMRAAIGEALGLSPNRVGIKATTNETMGFVGRREGIAAMAVAMVQSVA